MPSGLKSAENLSAVKASIWQRRTETACQLPESPGHFDTRCSETENHLPFWQWQLTQGFEEEDDDKAANM